MKLNAENAKLASDPRYGTLRAPSASDIYRFRRATALMIAARQHCMVPTDTLEEQRKAAGFGDWPERWDA
jgi:hypothetical protein